MDDENIMQVDYTFNDRLGPCEVCGNKESKYTCPKCEVKTCCVKCVRIHKKELDCDGIRDKTKFIKINSFTNLDLLSDYRLLEEVSRNVDKYKKDKIRQYRKQNEELPLHLYRLRAAATRREMILKFLPKQFTRRQKNKTYLDWKTQTIFWQVEWIFSNADNLKCVDEKCCENEKLGILLNKYFQQPEELDSVFSEKLQFYQSAGFNNVQVLLKAEEKRGRKFYNLDLSKTLKQSLKYKIIIENPTIYLVFKQDINNYDIIDSDEERTNANDEEDDDKKDIMKRLLNVKTERIKRKKKKNLLINSGCTDDELSSSEDEDSLSSDVKIPKRMFL